MSTEIPGILIIEDNITDAFWLKQSLERMGFSPPLLAYTIDTGIDILNREKPQIIICDLFFDGKPKGLDVLRQFASQGRQFIIVTSSTEHSFYDITNEYGVAGHLIKPFHPITLRSIIDGTFTNLTLENDVQEPYLSILRTKNKAIIAEFKDILFLYSERNYTFIKTFDNLYSVKRSLIRTLTDLDERFLRVHNSYVINTDHLKSITSMTVLVNKEIIPLGRAYRKTLTDRVKFARKR